MALRRLPFVVPSAAFFNFAPYYPAPPLILQKGRIVKSKPGLYGPPVVPETG